MANKRATKEKELRIWDMRSPLEMGKNLKVYQNQPQKLWNKAKEYFEFIDGKPWIVNQVIKGGDSAGMSVPVDTQRPYDIRSLSIYLGITLEMFGELKKSKNKKLVDVCEFIEEICHNQKFEGAAIGAFNATIITRDLGLADKIEQTTSKIKVTIK